ncbi:MAG: GNAT family N-acetyltransferase [Candidatus Competibacteraceae bacterium]|nr:GNAT family N-acetyltransferase [Candidatus Competibacteraceae bacterium]
MLTLPGRLMEIGRTCVHPDYRNGATIGVAVVRFSDLHRQTRDRPSDRLRQHPAGEDGEAARALYAGTTPSGPGTAAGATALAATPPRWP